MMKLRFKASLGAGLLVLGVLAVVPATAASAAPAITSSAVAPTPPTPTGPGSTGPAPTGAVNYAPASGASGGVTPLAAGPCTLYPSKVHQRKSGNYGTVGNKPYTECSVSVASIHQSTTVYKTAWWGNVDSGTFPGGNRNVSTNTQRNVEVTCTNSLSTTWFAVTDGTVVYGGTTYYSEVITPYNTYDCGT